MLFWCRRFNLYFVLAAVIAIACACQSPEKKRKKAMGSFRVHIEAAESAPTNRTSVVQVFRSAPVKMYVDRTPIVTEEQVKEAKVVDTMGGFALQIQLDRDGTYMLEEYTSNNRRRHLLIFRQFSVLSDPEKEEARWLAAPMISTPIRNGILLFTPDASREEAEQIAIGLNNVAKKLGTGDEPKW